ncbi:MAG: 2OG-Fe(II) oxygenase [Vicinamibacterales bacterium]
MDTALPPDGDAWPQLADELDAQGWSLRRALLSQPDCDAVAALYDDDSRFRSRVIMARHGFGLGEQVFRRPAAAAGGRAARDALRTAGADRQPLGRGAGAHERFPATHQDFLDRCHAAGQCRPTPLLLRYGPGDFNALHQDLCGAHVFPLQVAVLLAEPGEDFTGGEFVLTEQRPRMQSRAEVVPLRRGDAVVFAVHHRPVRGSRGVYRVTMRHGVSRVRSGRRHTLGIVLHDAQ